jgi:Zn-dependent protease
LAGFGLEQLFVSLLVLIVSLTVHEAAHAWTADQLGDPTARLLGRLSLNPAVHVDPVGTILFPLIALITGVPLIGWAKPVPVDMRHLRHPRRDFAIVAAAGPISNLLLAVLFATLFWLLPTSGGGSLMSGASVLLLAVLVNVLLAVFNMIPVPPLDGGNVLAGILPENLAVVFDRLRPFGIFILYGLMLTGVLTTITVPVRNAILSWLV